MNTLQTKLIKWLVIVIIFLVPLLSATGGFFEYEFIRLWLVYLGVSLSILILSFSHQLPLPPKNLIYLIAVWFIIILLTSITGLSFSDSLLGRYGSWLNSITSFGVFLSLGYLAFMSIKAFPKQFITYFITALTITTLLVIVYELSTKISGLTWQNLGSLRLTTTFRNPNHLGFYLSLVNVFLIATFITTRDTWLRFLSFIGFFVSSIGIILTQSRASWLTLGLVYLIGILWGIRNTKTFGDSTHKSLLLIIAAISILGLLGAPIIYHRLQTTFTPTTDRVSQQIRLQEWQTVGQIWLNNFWLGIGPENLDLVFPQYRSVNQNSITEEWQWRTITTRNYWLELLVTTGPLGLIGFLSLLWWITKKIPLTRQTLPFLTIIITYYLHSFFYNPNVPTQVLFWVAIGTITGLGTNHPITFKLTSTIKASLITSSLLSLWLLIRLGQSEYLASFSLTFLETQPTHAHTLMLRAYHINPIFDKNLRQLTLTQEEVLRQNQISASEREVLLTQFKLSLEQLEHRRPHDIENLKTLTSGWMRYASFSHTSHDRALYWGKQLIETDPTSPGSWDTLGLVYLDKQDLTAALETFHYILSHLKSDYPFAYFHIGETLRQMGQPEQALFYYNQALQLGYEGAQTEIEEIKNASYQN